MERAGIGHLKRHGGVGQAGDSGSDDDPPLPDLSRGADTPDAEAPFGKAVLRRSEQGINLLVAFSTQRIHLIAKPGQSRLASLLPRTPEQRRIALPGLPNDFAEFHLLRRQHLLRSPGRSAGG
ncbi:hypothetical protein [Roseomonas chloroacetimidivorans]|uniref:hypothetical protein n=1 Tax=Roseomonas chloroacetimidivorans TaxID=1766656 RepID=UPI003C70CA14